VASAVTATGERPMPGLTFSNPSYPRLQVQVVRHRRPGEQKHEQHEIREPDLAREHEAPPLGRHGAEHRKEQWQVPQRVDDQEQRDDGGDEIYYGWTRRRTGTS
jgi:hypothetical protein